MLRASLPAILKTLLALRQGDVAGADQAFNAQFHNILGMGTILTVPRLQGQITRVRGVPTRRQRNDVIQLVVLRPAPEVSQQIGLDACAGRATKTMRSLL